MSDNLKPLDLTPTWRDIAWGFMPPDVSGLSTKHLDLLRMAEVADLAVKHLDLIRDAEEGEGKGKPTEWIGCENL